MHPKQDWRGIRNLGQILKIASIAALALIGLDSWSTEEQCFLRGPSRIQCPFFYLALTVVVELIAPQISGKMSKV